MKFKDFLESKYNIDIHGKYNPYIGKTDRELDKKLKSFNTQLADLMSKLQQMNMGSSGDKNNIKSEIEDMRLKIDQVNYILKGK